MGRRLDARQLFLQRPVAVVADQDVDAVAIEGYGQAAGGEHLPQHGGVAVQVFRRAEVQRDDLRSGIVDGAEQGHRRPPALEPVEGTASELNELARGRFAGPAAAMLRRPPPMHSRQAQRTPEAADRFPGDREVLDLEQFFGGMGVIEALVAAGQERLHLHRRARRESTVREPSAALMAKRRTTTRAVALLEALKLPRRDAKRDRPVLVADPPGQRRRNQACPGQLLPAHRESLHGEMTFSRSSYPTTFLCSSSISDSVS